MARKTPKLEHAGLTHQASVNGNHIGPQHETSSVDTMTEDVTMQDDHGPNGIKNSDTKLSIRAARSDEGVQVLGRGVKELVQAVQALRHLGVEDLNLPLPKIVVVGDQSTGKSSLIEGMSEIKVPRKAGTCTRCPLEINLTESCTGVWTCRVSLFKKYIYEGNLGMSKSSVSRGSAKSEGATKARPLGPWTQQAGEDYHFATITNKADVPTVLHRAQLATLNPSASYQIYMPGSGAPITDHHQVKFSPNIIRLDISGPDLPNLSFYDLPGVINVSDTAGEEYLVSLVRNLVKSYITAEDSINLLAIPMTDDPANSSAFQLIKEVKAETRTVGCITKPDRRQIGEALEQWEEVLNGKKFLLGLGYFVIKNNPDPDVDHATARAEEKVFFESAPWGTNFSAHKENFGTIALQTRLSQLLTGQIQKCLPAITAQVEQKAEQIDVMLRSLPEPLSGSLPAVVLGELLKFEKALHRQVDGGSRDCPLQKRWDEEAQDFRAVLADTKPVLKFPPLVMQTTTRGDMSFAGRSASPGANRRPTPIEVDSDDDIELPTTQQHAGKKRQIPSDPVTPSKAPRLGPSTPRMIPFYDSTQGKRSELEGPISGKKFDLAEVESILQEAYVGGIPNLIHPKAEEEMIMMSMQHWKRPLLNFLQATKELCEQTVSTQVEEVFGHRQQTRYYEQILNVCDRFFQKLFEDQKSLLLRILAWELSKPKTLNLEALSSAKESANDALRKHSRRRRAQEYLNTQDYTPGKSMSASARMEKLAKVTDDKLPPEIHDREITAMSIVKGFYDVAYSRFVDIVCSSIHCEVFGKCRDELYKVLFDEFAVTDPGANERFAVLLAANPHDEERRAVLLREKETIERAQERLQGLV